ncbi:MAG: hypothetical protein H7296_02695, partial [Bacteroidia bacterium]|nr:hypothetical protein [Bacteroidia bacterium]
MKKKSSPFQSFTYIFPKRCKFLWIPMIISFFILGSCNKAGYEKTSPLQKNAASSLNKKSSTLNSVQLASIQPLNLGKAGDFTILTETGITTTGVTSIVGDIGCSPIA